MPQHDYEIANQTPANLRADLNNALSAIASNNSGASAPSTTSPFMWWADTVNNKLKIRNEADSAWIVVGDIDSAFAVTLTGEMSDLRDMTWSAGDLIYHNGTNLVNLGKGSAGQQLQMNSAGTAPEWGQVAIGVGQTWQDMSGSRASSTPYQNTTGRPIEVIIDDRGGGESFYISDDGISWNAIYTWSGGTGNYERNSLTITIPDGIYYQILGTFDRWWELR